MGNEEVKTPGTELRRAEYMVPRGECETKAGLCSGWKSPESVDETRGQVKGQNRREVPVLVGWALRLEGGGEGESSWERQE